MTYPLDDLRGPGAAKALLVFLLFRSTLGAATLSLVVGVPATGTVVSDFAPLAFDVSPGEPAKWEG